VVTHGVLVPRENFDELGGGRDESDDLGAIDAGHHG